MAVPLDRLAVAATVITVGTAIVEGVVLGSRGERPSLWLVLCLALAASLCAWAATQPGPRRVTALAVGGILLLGLGLRGVGLGGWPLAVAGVLALVAAWQARPSPRRAQSPS